MLDSVSGFVTELRAAGLSVSPTEQTDGLRALTHVGLDDRETVREALASTMVKRQEHRETFDVLFDVWFSPRRGAVGDGESLEGLGELEIRDLLDELLRSGDGAQLARLARAAVDRFGGVDMARTSGTAYPSFVTMRALDLDGALRRLLAGGESGAGRIDELTRADEYDARVRRVRREVESELRARMVERFGPEDVARTLRRPLPEDVALLHASRDDIASLRRALVPLGRRLATRMARDRRHHRRGRVDVRSTVRHSLSYGGAFVEPRFRRRHPAKPEIVVLADISGSVAAFARFTLELVHAIAGQFAAVRSFVFIDGVDEVTAMIDRAGSLEEALARIDAEADVVWADGHSDYGHAFEAFWSRWGGEIGGRSSVVVLGDARNNYHQPADWVLAELRRKARRVWWLNPEPRSYWDTGDSIASLYAPHCHAMVECRTLRQLERFVAFVV